MIFKQKKTIFFAPFTKCKTFLIQQQQQMEDKLIHFVREHSFLYDRTKKSYKNVELKEQTWKTMAQELNEPGSV